MYLRLTTLTKNLPQMSSHLYFLLFVFRSGAPASTHDSADCWSAHRSPAARDSFEHMHDWCKAGWVSARCPPPQQKSWLLGSTYSFTGFAIERHRGGGSRERDRDREREGEISHLQRYSSHVSYFTWHTKFSHSIYHGEALTIHVLL